jgi:hypothetical protein
VEVGGGVVRGVLASTRQYVICSHAAATHHNICTLQDAGFRKATVLVRNPRDNTISWTYHIRAMGNSFIQHLPKEYYDWPHARQLAFQVCTFLPAAVNWIGILAGSARGERRRSPD